jgi:hypothetical protein
MKTGESLAPCGNVNRETEAHFSKILHAEEISTVDESVSVARKRKREVSSHSQVAGADGASRQQAAVELETVIAANPVFQ